MKNLYKNIGKVCIVLLLMILLVYVCNITLLPDSFILMQGEKVDVKTMLGLTLQDTNTENPTLLASNNLNKNKVNQTGAIDVSLNLFGKIPIKDIKMNVIPKTAVVPVGKAIGMKLYTDGVLVVGMSEINGKRPYENSGLQEGDRITKINNEETNNTEELIATVNKCKGNKVRVTYKRDEEIKNTSIEPVKTDEDEYKLGLWVRDSTAGVGTMTFYEPSSGMFAALGHGITDIDTSDLITIASGELVTTRILSIVKGERGTPGEVRGTIDKSAHLGTISKNTGYGIYGKVDSVTRLNINEANKMEVALRDEIKLGKAQILCQLDNGKTESYDIEIQKLFLNNNENNKSMMIKVTDQRLLEKTGGIIQGMSGAPIIQNGKFIGAVTHVLVKDPTAGYGVFADIMVKQLKEVN